MLLLTFLACAPPTSLPPPVPSGAADAAEFGGAVMGGVWAEERCPSDPCVVHTDPTYAGQVYGQFELSDDLMLGGTSYLGNRSQEPLESLFGAGAYLRYTLSERVNHSMITVQGGGGWKYWQFSVPMTWRISNSSWFYVAPGVGSSAVASAQYLPFGLSYTLDQQIRVHMELGAETHLMSATERDNVLAYGALGVSITP